MSAVQKEKGLVRVSVIVIAYGVFVAFSLLIQCLIPLLELLHAQGYYANGRVIGIFNPNFQMPLEAIVFIYTLIVPLYLGIDRATAFMFITKEGANKVTIGDPKRLMVVMIQTFIIYLFGLALALIFDRDLQLTQLATAFGLSVLLYVGGKKCNTLAEALHGKKSIDTELEELVTNWKVRRKYLYEGGPIVDTDRDGRDDVLYNLEEQIVDRKEFLDVKEEM